MKSLLTRRNTLATSVLLGLASLAGAQSLGAPTAPTFLGRPLDVSLPVRFASGEARDECVHADVYFGGRQLADSQVRASVTGAAGERFVRITTAAVVDVPTVRLDVRAGCGGTITRRFDVLADLLPSHLVAAMSTAAVPATAAAVAAPARSELGASAAPTPAPARMAPVAVAPQQPPAPPPARVAPVAPVDAGPLLRLSGVLSTPTADAGQRAAAALLWQALSAQPQDVMRTVEMLRQLEGEVERLRSALAAPALAPAAAQAAPLAPAGAVSPLAALPAGGAWGGLAALALLAGSLAWAWSRRRRARVVASSAFGPASESPRSVFGDDTRPGRPASAVELRVQEAAIRELPQRPQPRPAPKSAPVAAPVPAAAGAAAPPAPARRRGARPPAAAASAAVAAVAVPSVGPGAPQSEDFGGIDFDFSGTAAPAARVAEAPAPAAAAPSGAARPTPRPAGPDLRVETLATSLQETEFLARLGLWGDAMDVIKQYLSQSVSPAPMGFYELMRLCVLTDDKSGLAAVRRRYELLFGMEPPPFEHVSAALGIETHLELMERIKKHWGTAKVLRIIEDRLFNANADLLKPLSLTAGHDLIALHGVAQEVVVEGGTLEEQDAPTVETDDLAPWAHAGSADEVEAVARRLSDVPEQHVFALDVDLDFAPAPLPERDPLARRPAAASDPSPRPRPELAERGH